VERGFRVDYGIPEAGVILYSASEPQKKNVPISDMARVGASVGAGYLVYKVLRTILGGLLGGPAGALGSAVSP
jgi:hypothetical protein